MTADPGPTAEPFRLEELARLIDHTLLKPDALPADISRLCSDAVRHAFWSVCVNPVHVARAAAAVAGTNTLVCTVAGFPLGAERPDVKVLAARAALDDGAHEVDMVVNIGALKAGESSFVLDEVRLVASACHEAGALCKVILETVLLSDAEKVLGAQLAADGGADFVKTSTGFAAGGATEADVALLRRTVAPRGLGVKASGGIRTLDDLIRMVAAGATRIGTSSGVRIVEDAKERIARMS
ncbi:MAG: deoxyribose-phosphate aldolase [Vicinamibacterales bacterium]